MKTRYSAEYNKNKLDRGKQRGRGERGDGLEVHLREVSNSSFDRLQTLDGDFTLSLEHPVGREELEKGKRGERTSE